MTVIDVKKDSETLTMTVTAEFNAPVERVWQMWANPRLLERWWGPPAYPATVLDHDLSPGGRVSYYMTGPEGDRYHGWWRMVEVQVPNHLVFEDGFADTDGKPDLSLPTMTVRVGLDEVAPGVTVMAIESMFASDEAMAQVLDMGAEEGMTLAVSQIDQLLLVDVIAPSTHSG